jgi:hypothetical protein
LALQFAELRLEDLHELAGLVEVVAFDVGEDLQDARC